MDKSGLGSPEFQLLATTIEKHLLSGLEQSAVILKLPTCSLSTTPSNTPSTAEIDGYNSLGGIPNLAGIAVGLAAATTKIFSFKDIVHLQRNYLLDRLRHAEMKLNQVYNTDSGVLDQIATESQKIRRKVHYLDTTFRHKFCFRQEFPSTSEIDFGPCFPSYGITPLEFIEGLAASISGYIWTIMTGIPELGIVIRDNKSMETYAISNLPLSSKLEIILSLIHYIEKLTEHVLHNLEITKRNTSLARNALRSQSKQFKPGNKWLTSLTRRVGIVRENPINISRWEAAEYLASIARIVAACNKADELITQIADMIDTTLMILQQTIMYLSLKLKMEPAGGIPTLDNEVVERSQAWQSIYVLIGLVSPPSTIPHPMMVKRIKKKHRKNQNKTLLKYKSACQNKILELEMYLEQFYMKHRVSIDVPMVLLPTGK